VSDDVLAMLHGMATLVLGALVATWTSCLRPRRPAEKKRAPSASQAVKKRARSFSQEEIELAAAERELDAYLARRAP
jgi:hypothetical protein